MPRVDTMHYELRVSLDTRDVEGQPTTMYVREMIAYDTLVSARSTVDVIEHVVRHALHKLATEHVDAHLRFG